MCHGVSNHQYVDCLLSHLFRRTPKKISKPHVMGHCEGKPPMAGGFPSQGVSNAENVSILWRHRLPLTLDCLLGTLLRIGQSNFKASYVVAASRFNARLYDRTPISIKNNVYPALLLKATEAWFNINMPSYQYRKSQCGYKTVGRLSYLHNWVNLCW